MKTTKMNHLPRSDVKFIFWINLSWTVDSLEESLFLFQKLFRILMLFFLF